ncbi:MAG TPA: helix-turn-helix transcriptional regulator [Chthonomonadaceae bacterium]|nr:helix-turn-helix transcriptional regulator [Chthonomonadaceae bacterium]
MAIKRQPALVALGQQIRKVRKEHGFSQEGFAAEVGLDRSYYGSVERGERNVAALNLMRIAAALGVEVGELFPKARVFRALLDRTIDTDEEQAIC